MMARRPNDAKCIPITTHKNSVDCMLDSTRCASRSLERSGAEGCVRVFTFLDLGLSNDLLLDLQKKIVDCKRETKRELLRRRGKMQTIPNIKKE